MDIVVNMFEHVRSSLTVAVCSGVLGISALTAAEKIPAPSTSVYPIRVPKQAVKEEKTGSAVSQPFKPAARVPRRLPTAQETKPMTNLVFDAEIKEIKAKPLEYDLKFSFAVTNVSDIPVVIGAVRTSCGCTVADLPPLPWKLLPNEHGKFDVSMDVRGKKGAVTKTVLITTDQGRKSVYVRGILPDAATLSPEQRKMNQMLAKADRQAVFKGACASCHVEPAKHKSGSALFEAACNICHGTAHRAEMVPDLNIAKPGRDYNYWMQWITHGKEGTLMPAFGKEQGGPLSDAQIISLAHWLSRTYPSTEEIKQATPVQRGK